MTTPHFLMLPNKAPIMSVSSGSPSANALARRVRIYLQQVAVLAQPITYKALADALELTPPNTIHRTTEALEQLMREDAVNGHPFLAALVISRARGGLPALGFFDLARRLERFDGDPAGPEARAYHDAECAAAVAFWSAANAYSRGEGTS